MGRDNFFFIIHLIFKVMVAAREFRAEKCRGV
jgi:hypothetical protein